MTRFAVDSRQLAWRETVNAQKEGLAPLYFNEAQPEGAPLYGVSVSFDHIFQDMEYDELFDRVDEYVCDLREKGINAFGLSHTPSGHNMEQAQLYIFVPYTKVKSAGASPAMSYLEGDPAQMNSFLSYLCDHKLIDPANPEHRVMIEDCFPLRMRVTVFPEYGL